MKPGQHGAGLTRNLARTDGDHHDPTGTAPGLSQVEAQGRPGAGEVGSALLQQDLPPTQHFFRSRPGGAQGQVDDPHGFQAGEALALHILVREADGQDAVVRPGGLAGAGCGAGTGNGIAFPPASGEGENPAG